MLIEQNARQEVAVPLISGGWKCAGTWGDFSFCSPGSELGRVIYSTPVLVLMCWAWCMLVLEGGAWPEHFALCFDK